jgi:ABC-type sugar transport system ATPase subunit
LCFAQILAKKFRPLLYWAAIVASTTFGTTMADFADRSLRVPKGETLALVGDNGAGKSSLIKVLWRSGGGCGVSEVVAIMTGAARGDEPPWRSEWYGVR